MELEQILYLVGQGLGIVAIALGFISYQMKTQGQVIMAQLFTGVVFCAHYGLIGATSGMAMNIVCVVQNGAFYLRNKKGSNDMIIPIFFTAAVCIAGIITWEAWYSVFVLAGIGIHTFCMALPDAQTVRKTLLITCPLVLIYDAFALSIGGIIYESIAMI